MGKYFSVGAKNKFDSRWVRNTCCVPIFCQNLSNDHFPLFFILFDLACIGISQSLAIDLLVFSVIPGKYLVLIVSSLVITLFQSWTPNTCLVYQTICLAPHCLGGQLTVRQLRFSCWKHSCVSLLLLASAHGAAFSISAKRSYDHFQLTQEIAFRRDILPFCCFCPDSVRKRYLESSHFTHFTPLSPLPSCVGIPTRSVLRPLIWSPCCLFYKYISYIALQSEKREHLLGQEGPLSPGSYYFSHPLPCAHCFIFVPRSQSFILSLKYCYSL